MPSLIRLLHRLTWLLMLIWPPCLVLALLLAWVWPPFLWSIPIYAAIMFAAVLLEERLAGRLEHH